MDEAKNKQLKYEVSPGGVNATKINIPEANKAPGKLPDGQNGAVGGDNQKEEQERTRIKKKLFLEYFEKTRGVISAVCQKIEIDRGTYYLWKNGDPEFAKAISAVEGKRSSDIEDLLMAKIFIERDGTSIRYWLDRKHPGYKPKNITEVVTGERTLEDLLAEDEEKLNAGNNKQPNSEDEPGADRGDVKDPGQEGGNSAVQNEPVPGVLLGAEEIKKPDNQTPAEGIK